MRLVLFWMLVAVGFALGGVGLGNVALILLGKSSAAHWQIPASQLFVACGTLCSAWVFAHVQRIAESNPVDLTTELQAQLAAEMIRKKTLKRLDVSEQGLAINGNRVGS